MSKIRFRDLRGETGNDVKFVMMNAFGDDI
jgi:hypothetical protein